jgi:hypothetical protein
MMDRSANQLPRWQRWMVYGAGFVLLATGLAWLAVHYTIGSGAGQLPHPVESWAMTLHGLSAFFAIFSLGILAAAHIPYGWRYTGRHHQLSQRRLGIALCGLGAALVGTGYLLYYFSPEPVRPALGWAHAVAGIAMGVALGLHQKRRGHPGDSRAHRAGARGLGQTE